MSYLRQLVNKHKNCLLNIRNNLTTTELKASLHLSHVHNKEGDRRSLLKGLPKPDEGSQGERSRDIDFGGYLKICEFPSLDTPDRLYDHIPFKDLPILHIRTTKNNTILSLTESGGQVVLQGSAGMEGFKNCRKGTNVAAQVTALNMSQKMLRMGYKSVRLCIKGLGPGRMSSIKGIQTGGVNIVSITDTTPICEPPRHRPPAARSV